MSASNAWTVAWLLALVLLPLARRFPLAAGAVLVALLALTLSARRKRLERDRRGWWVEYVSPGVLRGGEDEFAIAYHEGNKTLYFSGTEGRRGERSTLVLPGAAAWPERVEAWARNRRDEIVARIREDDLVRKRVDVTEG
jgi:hypothetical protein